jgi:hypothetical protein
MKPGLHWRTHLRDEGPSLPLQSTLSALGPSVHTAQSSPQALDELHASQVVEVGR